MLSEIKKVFGVFKLHFLLQAVKNGIWNLTTNIDVFRREPCLPSDNKMTPSGQEVKWIFCRSQFLKEGKREQTGIATIVYVTKVHSMQPGNVPVTYADSRGLEKDYGFRPEIGIREGLRRFCEWYAEYYKK